MRLYDVKASPNCHKVRVVARELGLPLQVVPIDFVETKHPDYLERNPTGKVPTLVDDDGTVVWESGAILIHLAEKDPRSLLLPTEIRPRAEVFRWMFFGATHLQPWISQLGQERVIKPRMGAPVEEKWIALAERDLARFMPVLESCLGQREFLVEGYSIADIALGCGFEDCEARGISLAPYPAITAWRERLRARPAWKD